MKSKPYLTILALVLIGVLLFPVQPAMAKSPGTFLDLGTLGGDFSSAARVNDVGQVVGSSTLATGEYHAFLWQHGAMTDLGTLLADPYNYATDINNAGQVVGYSAAGPESEIFHAFLWQDGQMLDLSNPDCARGHYSAAYAINQAGQIVGETCFPGSPFNHAFLWSNGAWINLGDLGGGGSTAFGINDRGQVVGASVTPAHQTHAFLWDRGVMTDLGTIGNGSSLASAINNAGQIVGNTSGAFLWDNGTMTSIAPGSATDINNQGQVVGYPCFLWQNGVVSNSFAAGDFCQAFGINNRGQIAGGYRFLAQPDLHAFLWTP